MAGTTFITWSRVRIKCGRNVHYYHKSASCKDQPRLSRRRNLIQYSARHRGNTRRQIGKANTFKLCCQRALCHTRECTWLTTVSGNKLVLVYTPSTVAVEKGHIELTRSG